MCESRPRTWRRFVIPAIMVVSVCGYPPASLAQKGEDVAKGLLKALIESQLEKSRQRQPPGGSLRPGQPGQLTREVQQLRVLSATHAQETARLAALLRNASIHDHAIRHHLPEVIQFQAASAAVQQQTHAHTDHLHLVDSYRQLNADWLTLSHRLRSCDRLSPQAAGILDVIGQADAQYCSLLGIEAQFDSRQLVRAADMLSAELRQLVSLIQYRVGHSAGKVRLMGRLERLQQQVNGFAGLALEERRLPVVIGEYEQIHSEWAQLQAELDRYNNRELTRSVQRVESVHQVIHDLLRIEHRIDSRLVQHLLRDVDVTLLELFRNVTLEELMNLPDSGEIADAASTTYGTLQNLVDVVQRNESPEAVGEAWSFLDESWRLLEFYLNPIGNQNARLRIVEVSGQLHAIRESLGLHVAWDYNNMVQRAAALENTALRLLGSVQRWHAAAGIREDEHTAQARQLSECTTELSRRVRARASMDDIRAECDEVITVWQELRPHLAECETPERDNLNRLASSLTPELLYLRSMLPTREPF